MTCPIQSPLQVQRNPLIKPRRPASNVPTVTWAMIVASTGVIGRRYPMDRVRAGAAATPTMPTGTDALAAALATLIGDPGLRRRMGAAGQHRMQKEFSIATMADKHVKLYETILNG